MRQLNTGAINQTDRPVVGLTASYFAIQSFLKILDVALVGTLFLLEVLGRRGCSRDHLAEAEGTINVAVSKLSGL